VAAIPDALAAYAAILLAGTGLTPAAAAQIAADPGAAVPPPAAAAAQALRDGWAVAHAAEPAS
jgi:hypothetical protein